MGGIVCAKGGKRREKGENIMSDARKGYGSTMVLMILGVLALYGGARWLLVLIPAATLVWYTAARALFRRSRN